MYRESNEGGVMGIPEVMMCLILGLLIATLVIAIFILIRGERKDESGENSF